MYTHSTCYCMCIAVFCIYCCTQIRLNVYLHPVVCEQCASVCLLELRVISLSVRELFLQAAVYVEVFLVSSLQFYRMLRNHGFGKILR